MPHRHSVPLQTLSAVALAIVAVKLAAHVAVNIWTPYEFHRDAFLYMAMGSHLRILHMDFPPLMALISETVRGVAGASLFAYRLVPALAGTAVLFLAILLARELGGGQRAQLLTALAVLVNPLFLRAANLFQPVVLDQLWWLLGLYALTRYLNTGAQRWWLLLGVAGGVGLLTKFSIVFFGTAVLIGLLLTPHRRAFLGPWPWAAIGIALLLGSPSVIGQVTLGFPVLEQMTMLQESQLARVGFGEFLFDQILWQPVGLLMGVAGIAVLIMLPHLRPYRVLGWIALTAFAIFVLMNGKAYYFGPIHPLLFAAGAVALERLLRPRLRTVSVPVAAVAIVLWGFAAAPFGLPVVPPEPMARFAGALGITTSVRTNWGEYLPLPQDYADMLGWREKAEAVARVYGALTPTEQAEAVLFARNYGQAGALDFYGRELGLPPVVSLAGSFYNFGPGERPGAVIIFLGLEIDDLDPGSCKSLELADRVVNPWGVPEERDVPILVCRQPSMTLQEFWEREGRPHWG
jgi:4-amino-4-deoxy-L-arabinose transferase-like glycosyltransferase